LSGCRWLEMDVLLTTRERMEAWDNKLNIHFE